MKVLLKTDIKKLGRRGDIVDVADGYAMSALIPTGKADVASPEMVRQSDKKIQRKHDADKKADQQAHANARLLKGGQITITGKAEGDRLFGSIGPAEVAQELKTAYNIDIDTSGIHLTHHPKDVGDHLVRIDLGYGADVDITVTISGQ